LAFAENFRKSSGLAFVGFLLIPMVLFLVLAGAPLRAAENGDRENPLERYCNDCHSLEQVYEKRAYMAEWWKIVGRMSAYDGSEISTRERLEVLRYLKENLAVDGPGARARQQRENERKQE
jgi:hypothetical protein